MSRVFLCLVAVLFSSALASAQPPIFATGPGVAGLPAPPRDAAVKTGTARIRGRVVAADTGQPLRKAQVRAFSGEMRENRLATTDANGAYELKDLPAGRYQLTAQKGSFVQLQYGQSRPFEAGKPLEIADRQTVDKVDFSLPRGALITGRVVDELGEPTPDAQVMAMRYQFVQGRRQLLPTGRQATTNDIGEYRLYGLPPGQYYLSATLPSASMGVVSDDRSGYTPVYYPGTSNVADAQRLNVGLGQALTEINFSLIPGRLSRISGTVVDSEGRPLAGGTVIMVPRTSMFMSFAGGQIRPDGSFLISNVAPGEYVLRGGMGGFGAAVESILTTLTVGDEDIAGLRLAGTKGSTVTGRIVLPQAGSGSIRPSMLQLMTMTAQPDPLGGAAPGRVNEDWTFEIKAQPGHQLIRLFAMTPGVTMKAVRLNGSDVTDSGIEFKANEDVSGLEIELTTQVNEVSGVVTNARGETIKDYTVIVFARDPQLWTHASRYLGGGRPDQAGRFKTGNLPPGEYYAVAMDYVEPGNDQDPEFLERIRGQATRFSLGDGETKTLDLKLTTSP